LVKIFAETDDRENSVYKPVCTLVSPMLADRIVESPNHAARFVSLIPFQRIESPGNERVEVWHSIQAFLARGCGDAEDHAVLLCNLLLGFGLDTYVCIGTNADGAHAWVLSRVHKGDGFGSEMCKTIFWESLTGQKFESSDARVHRFYRTISCVFNHKSFYANI
jgi:centrosomal protein CEP76